MTTLTVRLSTIADARARFVEAGRREPQIAMISSPSSDNLKPLRLLAK
jgi:hypothetical protein